MRGGAESGINDGWMRVVGMMVGPTPPSGITMLNDGSRTPD